MVCRSRVQPSLFGEERRSDTKERRKSSLSRPSRPKKKEKREPGNEVVSMKGQAWGRDRSGREDPEICVSGPGCSKCD